MDRFAGPPLYERAKAYPKPPTVAVPEIDEELLQLLGCRPSRLTQSILAAAFRLSGFRSFHSSLPENLEHLLSTVNIRLPGLDALPISATAVLADDPADRLPIERAASLVFAAYEMYEEIKRGSFSPDMHRGQILEMGQYSNLFATTLTVRNGRARLVKTADTSWIAVLVRRRLFRVKVGRPGKDTSFAQLVDTLAEIAEKARTSPQPSSEIPLGVLTAADHVTQLRVFRGIERTADGHAALEALRQNFLVLCLDLDVAPGTYEECAYRAHSSNLVNRWYHQSLQIVVFGNAKAAAIFNFTAYLDGNTMMRAASELQRRAQKFSLQSLARAEDYSQPRPRATEVSVSLPARMAPRVLAGVQRKLDNQQATFTLEVGKKDFEKANVAPIPAFVVGLEAAALRITRHPQPIHQFLSMSRYCCMDLTTAQVATPEVVQTAELINSSELPERESFRASFERAVDSQIQTMRRARATIDWSTVLALFWRTRSPLQVLLATVALRGTSKLLRLLGQSYPRPKRRAIVISHPTVFDNVPIVGRPGVRLPYVDLFALHYQIFDDRTVLTFMPGMNWTVPNAEMAEQIRVSLERMLALLGPVPEPQKALAREEAGVTASAPT